MRSYDTIQTAPAEEKKIDIKTIAIIVLVVILAGMGIWFFFMHKSTVSSNMVTAPANLALDTSAVSDTELSVITEDSLGDSVIFQGYDTMNVSPGQAVRLNNDASNIDIYIKYVIMNEDGQQVLETDLIPPGQYVRAILSDYLTPGSYYLYFKQEAYTMEGEEFVFVTDASNAVSVTILAEGGSEDAKENQ